MSDMGAVIVPKSDQINADDLIAGPMTIRISRVAVSPGTEQPVSMFYEGDGGKPYRPCKSMCRVLVAAWGPDSSAYVGRSLTLYRDPTVKWGGMDVGGIRISHLSHLDRDMVMALTATRGSRKPYTVKPLQGVGEKRDKAAEGVKAILARIEAGEDITTDSSIATQRDWLSKNRPELAAQIDAAIIPATGAVTAEGEGQQEEGEVAASSSTEGRDDADMGEGFTGAEEREGLL